MNIRVTVPAHNKRSKVASRHGHSASATSVTKQRPHLSLNLDQFLLGCAEQRSPCGPLCMVGRYALLQLDSYWQFREKHYINNISAISNPI